MIYYVVTLVRYRERLIGKGITFKTIPQSAIRCIFLCIYSGNLLNFDIS